MLLTGSLFACEAALGLEAPEAGKAPAFNREQLLAVLSSGGQSVDMAFNARGQSTHRLKDAKTLLRTSSVKSLVALMAWRKSLDSSIVSI